MQRRCRLIAINHEANPREPMSVRSVSFTASEAIEQHIRNHPAKSFGPEQRAWTVSSLPVSTLKSATLGLVWCSELRKPQESIPILERLVCGDHFRVGVDLLRGATGICQLCPRTDCGRGAYVRAGAGPSAGWFLFPPARRPIEWSGKRARRWTRQSQRGRADGRR